MIVIARNFGQLGNRLILSANLMAAAAEYGVPLWNPSFARYANYFTQTRPDLWCRFPAKAPGRNQDDPISQDASSPPDWLREVVYRGVYVTGRTLSHLRVSGFPFHVVRIGNERRCDLTDPRFARMARSRRPLLVSGWKFDAGPLLAKHAAAIRRHYQILPTHQHNVHSLVHPLHDRADVVIGVHVRQGDYAKFQNGRYFYSIDQYAAAMRRVQDRLGSRRVAFLVCGNAKLDARDFGSLDVTFGTGHLVEDLYSLARTDAMIGPPSTFTGWASFHGQVPLYSMETAAESFQSLDPDFAGGTKSASPVAA